ncbi:kynurenine formamidase [Catenulispora sp. MAP12-49]|uniref:cyclase family protein n=1 Tax=Catenulispora sp. MAP12-49 TaxID=3156302 RepID=UPI0035160222
MTTTTEASDASQHAQASDASQDAQTPESRQQETFRELGARLSNWGRWGVEDERGTANLITAERLVAAGRLIRQGKVFDLGIPVGADGPQGTFRQNPLHVMLETGQGQQIPCGTRYSDDYIVMPLQSSTQWDALAHVYYDDRLYNGFGASSITVKGAARCSIDKQAKGIAGRAVLLDVAALHGVEWLAAGTVITPADLEAAAERQGGVRVGPGDILLVRTGWRRKFLTEHDPGAFLAGEPGLGMGCCEWLKDRDVAAVASDNWAIEVLPGEVPGEFLTVHLVLIRDMGMTLGELLDLEELAADCEADGVWEFFFTAPPLKVTGGVGTPINPLALK